MYGCDIFCFVFQTTLLHGATRDIDLIFFIFIFDEYATLHFVFVHLYKKGFPTLAMDNEIRCSLSIAILCLSVAIQTRCNDWLTTTDAALLVNVSCF